MHQAIDQFIKLKRFNQLNTHLLKFWSTLKNWSSESEYFVNIIQNKEPNQWDKLKENVLTGYGCVITLFDISEILKILECKYIDEFTILGA